MSAESKKSIFLVEDSKEIRNLVQMLYESEGYRIETATDGKDALQKLRAMSELPGLILLDLMMPIMDGFEFRGEQVKDARLSPIPVLIMTADGNVDAKARILGVQGSLRKPVDVSDLLDVAEQYC